MSASHKTYHATRRTKSPVIVFTGKPAASYELPLAAEVADLSPFFDWGRNTPGTAQLAAAILADFIGPDFAAAYHVRFAREFLAGAPVVGWTLEGSKVAEWCKCREAVCV